MENDGFEIGKQETSSLRPRSVGRSVSEEAIGALISKLNISCRAGFRATICRTDI